MNIQLNMKKLKVENNKILQLSSRKNEKKKKTKIYNNSKKMSIYFENY